MSRAWFCLKKQRFEYQDYVLVPVQPENIEPIRCWRNAQLDALRQTEPISPEQQKSYFTQSIWPTMELETPSNVLMGLLLKDRLIGYGGLVHIGWGDQRAEMSFLVDELRARDHDQYARDFNSFIALVRTMAFDDLRFHKLFTETYANRHHHIQVLESAGFKREGILRDHTKIGNIFVDSIIHAIIQD